MTMTDDYQYPTDPYDDELGYDANHNDSSQFCRHGTFIGSWWGPDYMCGWCESGEEPPTPAEQRAMDLEWADATAARFDKLVTDLAEIRRTAAKQHNFGQMATWLLDFAEVGDWGKAWRKYNRHGVVDTMPDGIRY